MEGLVVLVVVAVVGYALWKKGYFTKWFGDSAE